MPQKSIMMPLSHSAARKQGFSKSRAIVIPAQRLARCAGGASSCEPRRMTAPMWPSFETPRKRAAPQDDVPFASSLQRRQQAGHQAAALGEAVDFDMFVQG